MLEAARIDGASELKYFSIIIPFFQQTIVVIWTTNNNISIEKSLILF